VSCRHKDRRWVRSLSFALFLCHSRTRSLTLSCSLALLLSPSRPLAPCVYCVVSSRRPTMGSFSLFFLLFLSRSQSRSLIVSCSLAFLLSRSRSLALSLLVSLQPRRHRWKLSTRAARASERAMAATTARMLGACRHRGNHFLIYSLAILKKGSM